MDWRPKVWKNPYKDYILAGSDYNNDENKISAAVGLLSHKAEAFEAGADALLKSLLGYGNRIDNRIENIELLSKRKHACSTNWRRFVKQKEDDAYNKGKADGKRELLEALRKTGVKAISLKNGLATYGQPAVKIDDIGYPAKGTLVFIPDE